MSFLTNAAGDLIKATNYLDFFILYTHKALETYKPAKIETPSLTDTLISGITSALGYISYLPIPLDIGNKVVVTGWNRSVQYTMDVMHPEDTSISATFSKYMQHYFFRGETQNILTVELQMVRHSGIFTMDNILNMVTQNSQLNFFTWTIMIDGETWTNAVLTGVNYGAKANTTRKTYVLTFTLSLNGLLKGTDAAKSGDANDDLPEGKATKLGTG